MSVYTRLDASDLELFLRRYDVGELEAFEGISEGIENTNYFVDTRRAGQRRRFVLTVFESVDSRDIPYCLALMAFLAEHGLPCAHPVAAADGAYLQHIKDKPAALVQRLPGRSVQTPGAAECRQVGEVMGRFHLAGRGFGLHRANPRGLAWFEAAAARVRDRLEPADRALLDAELRFQRAVDTRSLPKGVIHADLFRDNVLFDQGRLSGVIDLYYACDGSFLYDLAVTANDWCVREDGTLAPEALEALFGGYTQWRALNAEERALWPAMLRSAALRFWLSRLVDLHFPRPGDLTHTKDPDVFRAILLDRIALYDKEAAC